MAGSADGLPAQPLLTLLDEATTQGRPALALSRRRAAELLGAEPDDRWWAERAGDWLAAGWRAELGPDAVTFLPAGHETVEPTTVQITVSWTDVGGPATGVTVDGREADLTDRDVRELARLAARMRAAARDGSGGGSGI